jgi:hypothetical protein
VREFINLVEALNAPLDITWADRSSEDVELYVAEFQIDEGHFKVLFKEKYYERGIWNIAFVRNDTYELTGTGDALKVMATVLKAVREFISFQNPRFITFEMKNDEQSRFKLYDRLMRMLMKEFPKYMVRSERPGSKHSSRTLERPPEYTPPPPREPEPEYDGPEVSFDELEAMLADLDRKKKR